MVGAFLMAFLTLMSSWSGQEDVSLGFDYHGRDEASLVPLIGMFVNVLPMSAIVPRGDSVLAQIAQTQGRLLSALRYAFVPTGHLIGLLSEQGCGSHLANSARCG
jgi:non-ribosomal peptide synthetase component F